MKYNTEYELLRMSEYGRNIQQMIDHCLGLEDRGDRQRCAESIVAVMTKLDGSDPCNKDAQQRVWNHFAAMTNYQLDIDYPYEINVLPKAGDGREPLKYPSQKIKSRHYGSMVEKFTNIITDMSEGGERTELSHLIANHMKRDLSNWSVETMSDERVTDDMAAYTQGKIRLDEEGFNLVSDGELLSTLIPTSIKRKRKR